MTRKVVREGVSSAFPTTMSGGNDLQDVSHGFNLERGPHAVQLVMQAMRSLGLHFVSPRRSVNLTQARAASRPAMRQMPRPQPRPQPQLAMAFSRVNPHLAPAPRPY